VWLRDCRTLAFVDPDGALQLVTLTRAANGRSVAGQPRHLPVPAIGVAHSFTQYDVSPDGRIYFVDRHPGLSPTAFGFVLGWRRLVE
jgi:hypothetical protein